MSAEQWQGLAAAYRQAAQCGNFRRWSYWQIQAQYAYGHARKLVDVD